MGGRSGRGEGRAVVLWWWQRRWSFFYPAPFCGHPQHGHLRGFAKLIATRQTIFVVSRKWFSLPVLLGSTKRLAIFAQQKKLAGELDKRGKMGYNHGILLLRSAPLLILLLVLTRLPLSGVRGRAVLPRRWFSCFRHPRRGHHGSPFSASPLSAMRFKLCSLRSCRIRRSAFAVRYST